VPYYSSPYINRPSVYLSGNYNELFLHCQEFESIIVRKEIGTTEGTEFTERRIDSRGGEAKLLECPYGDCGEAWMAVELFPGALDGVCGKVFYPAAFDNV
jgi:hypothetical protein